MRIQAVVFDLYETLVTELDVPVRRASSLASQLGVDERAYKREWNALRPQIILGRFTFCEALKQIVATLDGVVDEAVLEGLRAERVVQKAEVLRKIEADILGAVRELRGRRLKLCLVTNAFAEDVAGWDDSPLRPFFDVAVFSYAVRLAKPDPAIYLEACRALDVAPQRALFVGDGVDEVAGAGVAGLAASRALWFASRWPNAKVQRDDPGLWYIGEVVKAALAP
jgi:HAD superfamily hydrolase (TIGR01509 family)